MITWVGHLVILTTESYWDLFSLTWKTFTRFISQVATARFRWKETRDQMYRSGIESIPIIVFALAFISMMLMVEFSYHMKLIIRQDSLVPAFSTLLIIREMGPVVTSLLLASRIGAAIAAEIGSMRITEQLDALELLAVDPVEYLTIPRWLGTVFGAVCLSVLSIAVAIVGGAFLASLKLNYTPAEFFNTMFKFTRYNDIVGCVIKAAVFGTIIPIVASHHGYRCRAGAEGVGNAATASVVDASIMIIISDFVLTYLLYAL